MEIQRFNDFVFISLLAGIAVYWALFTIWAIINAYHHRRLNVGWFIAFALLNIIGYLVYYFSGKKSISNLILKELDNPSSLFCEFFLLDKSVQNNQYATLL